MPPVSFDSVAPVALPLKAKLIGDAARVIITGLVVAGVLARRIVPQPGAPNYATVAQHTVKQGDRLDLLAAKYLGDPLIFWLICDANGAIRPNQLIETPGSILNITMPQGVPGGAPSA